MSKWFWTSGTGGNTGSTWQGCYAKGQKSTALANCSIHSDNIREFSTQSTNVRKISTYFASIRKFSKYSTKDREFSSYFTKVKEFKTYSGSWVHILSMLLLGNSVHISPTLGNSVCILPTLGNSLCCPQTWGINQTAWLLQLDFIRKTCLIPHRRVKNWSSIIHKLQRETSTREFKTGAVTYTSYKERHQQESSRLEQ